MEYLRLLQPRDGEVGLPVDVQVEVEVDEDAADEDDDEEGDEDDDADGDDADGDDERTLESLHVPDDPSALSFLLTGIVQAELDRKQALLEASTAEERLRDLDELLERELDLLGKRLGLYTPDRRALADRRN